MMSAGRIDLITKIPALSTEAERAGQLDLGCGRIYREGILADCQRCPTLLVNETSKYSAGYLAADVDTSQA
jgi:hypothetical protein